MTLQPQEYAMINPDTPEREPVRIIRVWGTTRLVLRLKPGLYTEDSLFAQPEAEELEPITRAEMVRWMDEERVI